MASLRSLVVLASSLFLAAAARAQPADVEGGKDHPLVSRYPGSTITEYASREFDEFKVPLGKMAQEGIAKSQQVEGKLTRIHYQIPQGRSTLEVMRNYQEAFRRAGFQPLFQCAGEAQCGGGSVPDPNGYGWCAGCSPRQLTAKLSRPEGDVYVSLHAEQDNPGTPATVDEVIVEVKPMESGMITVDAASLGNDIERTGHASIYGIYFDTGKAEVKPESEATLKEIARLLQQQAALKLYVVGHSDNVGTLPSNLELSRRRADAVVKVLISRYAIPAASLSAQGDGPLAPVASNDSDAGRAKNRRVELVKQ
jgi:OmpA-OmpF porin, OOP family